MTQAREIRIIVLAGLCLLIACVSLHAETEDSRIFTFDEMPHLGHDLEQSFVARAGDDLLVFGGFEIGERQRQANTSVYALAAAETKWRELPAMEMHVYGGAVVSNGKGVIRLGGYEDDQPSKKVARYALKDETLVTAPLNDLPIVMPNIKAAIFSNRLYAIGSEKAYSLDLLDTEAQWGGLASWAATGANIVAVVPSAEKLFVFTGNADGEASDGTLVYAYTLLNGFKQVGRTDHDISHMHSAPMGEGHVVFISSQQGSNQILGYHAVTDKWVVLGHLPEPMKAIGMIAQGESFDLIGSKRAMSVKAIAPSTKFNWIDYGVVLVFLVGMVLVGTILAKREKKSSQDYFRAGNRVPWWASGLSLFATGASAISLMAMPGKAYATNWVFMTVSFYTIITLLPLSYFVYIPIIRRLDVATANEYLERRFNIVLRMVGSIVWSLIQMLGRMAALMLLPAIAITAITGVPMEVSIVIMGIVTTCYVFLGGLEGVIWTDVFQAIIMILAVVVSAMWALWGLEMGVPEAWASVQEAQKLHMFDWQISFVEPCVLIFLLNILITNMGYVGDQNYVQRIQCTATEKDAYKAVLTQVAVAVPLNGVLFALGTILYLYYMENPEMLSPAIKADGIFPFFAAQNLPAGMAGLVIAAILAATMSTLSSAINSVANLGVEDFYRRFKKNVSDKECLVFGRVLTVGLGIFGTVAAIVLANTNLKSIWDLYLVILSMLLGAITGIYFLGIFTKRANSAGVLLGVIASLSATYYVKNYTHIHFLANLIVGVVSCYVVGYVASLILPAKQKDIKGLTVYTLQPKEE